jgi:hypothetical protein
MYASSRTGSHSIGNNSSESIQTQRQMSEFDQRLMQVEQLLASLLERTNAKEEGETLQQGEQLFSLEKGLA